MTGRAGGSSTAIKERRALGRTPSLGSSADDIADPRFHFPDVSWLKRWRDMAVRGTTEVAGRPAAVVAARNTMLDIISDSDRMLRALDLERGVLLPAECFLSDVLPGVEEVAEIAFDLSGIPILGVVLIVFGIIGLVHALAVGVGLISLGPPPGG